MLLLYTKDLQGNGKHTFAAQEQASQLLTCTNATYAMLKQAEIHCLACALIAGHHNGRNQKQYLHAASNLEAIALLPDFHHFDPHLQALR